MDEDAIGGVCCLLLDDYFDYNLLQSSGTLLFMSGKPKNSGTLFFFVLILYLNISTKQHLVMWL